MPGAKPLRRSFTVGERVFFWSGRGSHGYGIIREIRDDRAFIDPEPDAIKGSDYRVFRQPAKRCDVWVPFCNPPTRAVPASRSQATTNRGRRPPRQASTAPRLREYPPALSALHTVAAVRVAPIWRG